MYHTAAQIPFSNIVFFVGGARYTGSTFVDTDVVELFDLNFGTLNFTNRTILPRKAHTMTFLQSLSKWLIVGGDYTNGVAELFDSSTFISILTNNTMQANRSAFTATVLTSVGSSDDIVLIAGGTDYTQSIVFSSAELFNSSSGLFTLLPSNMTAARAMHTATALPGNKVLLCGGINDSFLSGGSCELFDYNSGNFTLIKNPMWNERDSHTATLLNTGKVLIVGGTNDGVNGINNTELFDPITNEFLQSAPLITNRFAHTATLLPSSGVVLICGGLSTTGPTDECELYYS
jgi:hypothetical protein